jgi:hypothetical protein
VSLETLVSSVAFQKQVRVRVHVCMHSARRKVCSLYAYLIKSVQRWLWSSRAISVSRTIQIHKQFSPVMALELQVHFCIKSYFNPQANQSSNGSGAAGPYRYSDLYKFMSKQITLETALELQVHFCIKIYTKIISKSVQEWLWSSRSISVSKSIHVHKHISPEMALELQVHFCIKICTHS